MYVAFSTVERLYPKSIFTSNKPYSISNSDLIITLECFLKKSEISLN